jgi:hypothetical protein
MKSRIKIFESNLSDGIMSRNKKFYDKNLSQEEINCIFKKTRLNIGKKYGFNGLKIIQPVQKTDTNNVNYKDGKYVIINDNYLKNKDLWYENIESDIIIISSKFKHIVIGNQCADCPILIVEDRRLGVTALAHCGVTYIDRKLPKMTVEALQKEYNSNINDLYVYISSYAHKENYLYDNYPKWAKDKDIWTNSIIKIDNKYHIDMEKAIINQLNELGIKHLKVSRIDTISNPLYASHYASTKGNNKKIGQNFIGFFYK